MDFLAVLETGSPRSERGQGWFLSGLVLGLQMAFLPPSPPLALTVCAPHGCLSQSFKDDRPIEV